jgi:hypothetical protein
MAVNKCDSVMLTANIVKEYNKTKSGAHKGSKEWKKQTT